MSATQPDGMDQAFDSICLLLMPFFLLAAGDNPEKARTAVAHLLRAYNPTTPQELDLAARIVGFGIACLDNLRLSATSPDLPDTKILRYRSSAVSLNRSAEQCRTVLNKMRAEQPPPKPAPQPQPVPPAEKPRAPLPPMNTAQMEKAKTEARAMLTGLAKLGAACPPGQGMTAIHTAPDMNARIATAVTSALARVQTQGKQSGA